MPQPIIRPSQPLGPAIWPIPSTSPSFRQRQPSHAAAAFDRCHRCPDGLRPPPLPSNQAPVGLLLFPSHNGHRKSTPSPAISSPGTASHPLPWPYKRTQSTYRPCLPHFRHKCCSSSLQTHYRRAQLATVRPTPATLCLIVSSNEFPFAPPPFRPPTVRLRPRKQRQCRTPMSLPPPQPPRSTVRFALC
jgi:hypothetical protein